MSHCFTLLYLSIILKYFHVTNLCYILLLTLLFVPSEYSLQMTKVSSHPTSATYQLNVLSLTSNHFSLT